MSRSVPFGSRSALRFVAAATVTLCTLVVAVFAPLASATPVVSAADIPFSGISPGGVDMATGELILVMRPDLALSGPMPVVFGRYYASMLAREGLASGHMGPNWLGTYDWKLSVAGTTATLVTNRGEGIHFQQVAGAGWMLVSPTYANYRLDLVGNAWRITNPMERRLYFFDGTTWLLTQIVDEHGNALTLSYNAAGLLTQVADGLGRTLTFGYDASGFLNRVGDGTRTVTFGYTAGILTGSVDAAGHPWSFVYPPDPGLSGLLAGVTEPMGNTPITNAYDTSGRVSSQQDALGHVATYGYDLPNGNTFTDPATNSWTYQHDAQLRLVGLLDPAGGPTTFQYDPQGRLMAARRPMSDLTSYFYDPASGYPSVIQLADGAQASLTYSPHTVAGATFFDVATAGYPDQTSDRYGRDPAGNLVDWTDTGNFHWTATYNARGQILTVLNPTGGTTTLTYDPRGDLASRRDNAGNTAGFVYDGLDRLSQVNWPDGTNRHLTYDNLDALTTVRDESGKQWSYGYDSNERLVAATDPLLESTGYGYDGLDRVTQVTDPLGHAAHDAYDPNGRLMTSTDRTGRATSYGYDALNRLTSVANPAGASMQFGYDPDGRLTSTLDPLNHGSSYQYDFRDHLTHVTDPVGSGFDFEYDAMGRVHTMNAPLGRSSTYNYDARGLLTSVLAGGVETDFQYTGLGQLSQVTDPDRNAWTCLHDPQGRLLGTSDPLQRSTSYEYDTMSRPIRVTRPDGSIAHIQYDPVGRPLQIDAPFDQTGSTTINYSYDDAGRRTSATGASFSYDAAGRMTGSNGFGYGYDDEGRLTSETLAPGKIESYTYDNRGWLAQAQDWMGGVTSFQYDAGGRLTSLNRPNGILATYQYDAANRLTGSLENSPGPSGRPISSVAITRDPLAQITGIDRRQPLMPGGTTSGTASFAYDAASQLNGVAHDAFGRMTSDASRSFHWDGLSRLDHYAAVADSPRFAYDAFGDPRLETMGSQTVQMAWGFGRGHPTNDDMQVSLPSRSRLLVRTPAGDLLYAVDGASGARSYYHYDERGNTAYLTNDAGNVVTSYAYGPFGGVQALGETQDNAFTLGAGGGLMGLGASGLWWNGASVYDERTMRVISRSATESGRRGVAFASSHLWLSSSWGKGWDTNGWDTNGWDSNGWDTNGYDSNGYDSNGYDSNGYDSNGVPDNGMPDNGMPDNGMPNNGVPDNGMPDNGIPTNGVPTNGMPTNMGVHHVGFGEGTRFFLENEFMTAGDGGAHSADPPPGSSRWLPKPISVYEQGERYYGRPKGNGGCNKCHGSSGLSGGSAIGNAMRLAGGGSDWRAFLKTVPVKAQDDFGKVKMDGNSLGSGAFGGGYRYTDGSGTVHQGFYDEWDFHHYLNSAHVRSPLRRDIDPIEVDPFDDNWQLTNVPKNAPSGDGSSCVWCVR